MQQKQPLETLNRLLYIFIYILPLTGKETITYQVRNTNKMKT